MLLQVPNGNRGFQIVWYACIAFYVVICVLTLIIMVLGIRCLWIHT